MERLELTKLIDSGKPFTIRATDGEEYGITAEELIRIHPSLDQVTIFDSNGAFHFYKLAALTNVIPSESPSLISKIDIRRALDSSRPISITTSDGSLYEVPQPDYAWLPPLGPYVVIANGDGQPWVISLDNIAKLEIAPEGPAAEA